MWIRLSAGSSRLPLTGVVCVLVVLVAGRIAERVVLGATRPRFGRAWSATFEAHSA